MTTNGGDAASPAPEHRTVSRVMGILEAVVASGPQGLRLVDLADMAQAPKSSIHGLARGLVATGYLREQRGCYLPGSAVAMLSLGGRSVPAAYHDSLERLSKVWGETAVLATLAGDSVINIDVVVPDRVIRAAPPVHERRPLWPTGSGKVFLAFMDPQRRDAYLRRRHKDPQERRRIVEELAAVRDTRVAFGRGELFSELSGVVSPIMTESADVTLALGLSGPRSRMVDRLDELAAAVRTAAGELSTS